MCKFPGLTILLLFTTACTPEMIPKAGVPNPATTAEGAGSIRESAEARGLAFAQQHCSGCHAVSAGRRYSPNVDAPTFESVVNTPGLTGATIKPWLQKSHNFPDVMNFAIDPDQIDDLAAYMISLQRSDYVPPI